jgi:ABC-type transport system involved in multi-copper enzyme maturation permease subunit
MTRLIRIELLKLRTTRLVYGLLLAATGLSALFSLLSALARAGGTVTDLSTPAGLTRVASATGFAMALAGVAGITLTSGEFRHNTATLTYLSCPDRIRVLAAKVAAAAVAGAVIGLAAGVATTAVGLALITSRGEVLPVGAGTLLAHIAGAALGGALLAMVGAGLGALVRDQIGAVVALLTWALVMEVIIGSLFPSAQRYLPYAAATTLGGAKLGQVAFGLGRVKYSAAPLPFAAAAALVLVVALLLLALAARLSLPRDISQ